MSKSTARGTVITFTTSECAKYNVLIYAASIRHIPYINIHFVSAVKKLKLSKKNNYMDRITYNFEVPLSCQQDLSIIIGYRLFVHFH